MAPAADTERLKSTADAAVRAVLTGDLSGPVSERAAAIAEYVAGAFGQSTMAVLHYGSHVHGGGGAHDSAHDFFVMVEDTAAAFRSYTVRMRPRFSAGTAALLARMLPPNIVAMRPSRPIAGARVSAKCAVLSDAQLEKLCSEKAPDHFIKGRLFQPLRLAWVRDEYSRSRVEDALVAARAGTYAWARPHLPRAFDVDDYCRTLLAISYAGEIRPETSDRAGQIFEAQRHLLTRIYTPYLDSLSASGVLARTGGRFRHAQPVSRKERARVALYFRRSKIRATARWMKYVWLYDNWLDYLLQKVHRRSGVVIELTPRERQWPLVFLWPKAIRFLRSRR